MPFLFTPRLRVARPAAFLALLVLSVATLAASQPAPTAAFAFGPSVALGGGGEPGIVVDPSGSPFYVASADNIWRSDDKGASWKRITPPDVFSGDANIAVGSTGTLYYQTLWVGSSWSFTSFDHGDTWAFDNAVSTHAFVDRNWIAAYGPDTVYAKGDVFVGLQTPLLFKSTDSGMTFLPTTSIVDGLLTPSGGFKGALTVDPNSGTVYLPADQATNVISTVDGGAHLRYAPVPNPYGESYSVILNVAVDGAGTAYLAWISQDANKWTLQYSLSTDEGLTWSFPRIVASGGGASRVFPWSAANGTGNLVLAWYETMPGTPSSAGPDAVASNVHWRVRVAHVAGAHTAAPAITFGNVTDAIHRGPICTDGVTCAGGTRNLLDFLGVGIDPADGKALVVYTHDLGRSPTIMFARQTSGPVS